ncbi:MAG: phosphoribosylaminoimidazolesuccinocarboxamide synthase [Actinomycetia bacterium]|nr:phosphoribosylaminoimidazolesuccinocarboxamide synthase [Actinomycetes bacterium]MCP3910583.1 phosphoribosylaminoimidazolesuccinocarboxamide synthase [Actinomycetes bacterium]MCP4086075.1 phosphoribosylaminoimidazolesuccinocarboxamide synthase [Actinomycetes bacterium]
MNAHAWPDLGLEHEYSGKVRDIFGIDDRHALFVTSDRMSAFDVVMNEPVPDKGRVLTAMSDFWFAETADVCAGHLVSTDLGDLPQSARHPELAGRIMLVRRAEMLPVECIVRGYLSGSAWREYRDHGTMHGTPLPSGLRESDRLPEPVFTPSTKADEGHDMNISYDAAVAIIGAGRAEEVRRVSIEIYQRGAELAAQRGIVIADTKFEFGLIDGELTLGDEVLTPDSSRFWPDEGWEPGATPPSYDKQPVRDYLDGLDWDKQPPPPPLPDTVITASRERYVEAYERITSRSFSDW